MAMNQLEADIRKAGWKMITEAHHAHEVVFMKHPRHMLGEVVLVARPNLTVEENRVISVYFQLQGVVIDLIELDDVDLYDRNDREFVLAVCPHALLKDSASKGGPYKRAKLKPFVGSFADPQYFSDQSNNWFLVAYERALARRRTNKPSGLSVLRSSSAPATMNLTPCVHFGTWAFLTCLLRHFFHHSYPILDLFV